MIFENNPGFPYSAKTPASFRNLPTHFPAVPFFFGDANYIFGKILPRVSRLQGPPLYEKFMQRTMEVILLSHLFCVSVKM